MLLEKRSKSTKAINEINVVPYVDIMLVLLVIFMVVAPLAVQGLDINLPSVPADEIELENTEPFVIDVNENGQYFIEEDGGNVQVSLGFLEDRFARVIVIIPRIKSVIAATGARDSVAITAPCQRGFYFLTEQLSSN